MQGSGAREITFTNGSRHGIVQGFSFGNVTMRRATNADVDFFLIRGNTFNDRRGTPLSFAHGVAGATFRTEYITYYANTIHDIGPLGTGAEQDRIAIVISTGARYHWVVDNVMYDIAGDCVRTGTNPVDADPAHPGNEPWAEHIYIGRNVCHDTEENFLDIKVSRYVVVSQNEAFAFADTAGSAGEAMVAHYGATHIAFLFNFIHSSRNGFVGTDQKNILWIGNIFWNIGPYPGEAGEPDYRKLGTPFNAIHLSATSDSPCYIVFNTFAFNGRHLNNEDGSDCVVAGNIFGSTRTASGAAIAFEQSAGHAGHTSEDNIFDSSSPGAVVQITSTRYPSVSAYTAANAGKCSGCLFQAPRFVNAGRSTQVADDFRLQPDAPSVGGGAASLAAFSLYESWFGVPIQVDFNDNDRPENAPWDFGAHQRVR
jgi:hypothetical protein